MCHPSLPMYALWSGILLIPLASLHTNNGAPVLLMHHTAIVILKWARHSPPPLGWADQWQDWLHHEHLIPNKTTYWKTFFFLSSSVVQLIQDSRSLWGVSLKTLNPCSSGQKPHQFALCSPWEKNCSFVQLMSIRMQTTRMIHDHMKQIVLLQNLKKSYNPYSSHCSRP